MHGYFVFVGSRLSARSEPPEGAGRYLTSGASRAKLDTVLLFAGVTFQALVDPLERINKLAGAHWDINRTRGALRLTRSGA